MSVIDQIRQKQEEIAKLQNEAKQEALDQANKAIQTLSELGFQYKLVEGQGTTRTVPTGSGTRRTGIRKEVLAALQKNPEGMKTAQVREALGLSSDKADSQAVSNALSDLKGDGKITKDGDLYKAV